MLSRQKKLTCHNCAPCDYIKGAFTLSKTHFQKTQKGWDEDRRHGARAKKKHTLVSDPYLGQLRVDEP